ncbi:MAG: hypothetical protein E7484_04380 [Ruminococcaceae bacterium]|nr:hypothetical protein [Oscillospiraceae bacterium]
MTNSDFFLQNNSLSTEEDIDSLLDLASLTRELINAKLYEDINHIIRYIVQNNFTEALSWVISILQEELEKEHCTLESFDCTLGGHITHYDDFTQILQIDFNPLKNHIEKVYDRDGEVSAFFNVIIYKTGYENIYLVSSENFDTRDNDYIQYKLSFVPKMF